MEEYRVSLFAQELGTAEPVSAVKLDRALQDLRPGPENPPAARLPPPAPVAAPSAAGPIKHLGALDRLFPRG
jgi:ATP-dependent helicase HrpA